MAGRSVLGIDPGRENYAWAMFGARGKLVRAGFLRNPVSSLARAQYAGVAVCYQEMKELVAESGAQLVCFEQFAARQFGTSLSQHVNMMAGLLTGACIELGVEHASVMPSSWKNALNRNVGDLAKLYLLAAGVGVPPHTVDAVCIGVYAGCGFEYDGRSKEMITSAVRRAAKFRAIQGHEAEAKARAKARRKKRMRK